MRGRLGGWDDDESAPPCFFAGGGFWFLRVSTGFITASPLS